MQKTRGRGSRIAAPRRNTIDAAREPRVVARDAGDRVTALLHRIVARTSTTASAEFRMYGFNVQGARVLIALFDAGQMRVGELGNALALDLSTLSHLLRRFSRNNLVVRGRLDADNRSVAVALTPQGRKIAQSCKAARECHEAVLLKGFDASEVQAARDFLRRICNNVEEVPLDLSKRSKRPRVTRRKT
jgi:MarR family transcriptional regulator, organic hydroperoxide resistance regulator